MISMSAIAQEEFDRNVPLNLCLILTTVALDEWTTTRNSKKKRLTVLLIDYLLKIALSVVVF